MASKFITSRSAQTGAPLGQVAEKSLPATPIPSPVGRKGVEHKRRSSGEIVGSPPVTPRRTLSKRRTSIPVSPAGIIPSSSASPKTHWQKAKEKTVDTIVVLDHESGSLRRKRIHRRSATVHAHPREVPAAAEFEGVQRPLTAGLHSCTPKLAGIVTTAVSTGTSESQASASNGGGVLSSLRRSLSLGRSTSGRPRSRSRDGKAVGGEGEARGRHLPVPQLPVEAQEELERNRPHMSVSQADITPPASRDSKGAVPEKSHRHTGVAGAVIAGIASLKKRKSKAHLHHPSGQFYPTGPGSSHDRDQRLVPTTSNTHASDQAAEADQRDISMPALSHTKRGYTAPMPTKNMKAASQKDGNKSRNLKTNPLTTTAQASVELSGSAPINSQNPTTSRTKARRNSSAISSLLSLRPKSRNGMPAPVPTEPVPPMPVSMLAKPVPQQQQEQALAIKDSNVQNSAILAGIRDLQNDRKTQAATPGFRLQGISGASTQAETRFVQRARLVDPSHTIHTKGRSESGKKAHEASTGGLLAQAQAQRKDSFLVKFCKHSLLCIICIPMIFGRQILIFFSIQSRTEHSKHVL